MLGIYDVRTGDVHYYDSRLAVDQHALPQHAEYLLRAVTSLRARFCPDAPEPHFRRHQASSYNQQPDSISCGFFLCLFVQLFLKRRSGTPLRVVEPFLADYRRTVVAMMQSLSTGQMPQYNELPAFADHPARIQG